MDVLKSAFSARGITFLLASWGLPALVAGGVWWTVVYPAWLALPHFADLATRLAATKLPGVTMFLISWAALSLTLGLNGNMFFRLLEGYPIRLTKLGDRRSRIHWLHRENLRLAEAVRLVQDTLRVDEGKLARAFDGDPELSRLTRKVDHLRPHLSELQKEWSTAEEEVKRKLFFINRRFTSRPRGTLSRWRDYPNEERDFLPTKLGNRIRSFERYGNYRYGLDVITLWYEFVSVAKSQVLPEIEAARQKVEIFVGACVVSTLFAATALLPLLFPDGRRGRVLLLAGVATASLLSADIFYRKCVAETREWERSVVALVNTGRQDVARIFGLELPSTLNDERRVWQNVVGFVTHGSHYGDNLNKLREEFPLPALSRAAQRVLEDL